MLGVNAEFFHDLVAGGAHAESVDADDLAVEADVLRPDLGDAGFNRDAFATLVGQHLFAILLRLALETFEAGHRYHAGPVTQRLRGGEGMLQLASAGEEDEFEFALLFAGNVTTFADAFAAQFDRDVAEKRDRLSR